MKMIPGYAKSTGNMWLLSEKAIDVIKQYMERFPRVFELLDLMERLYVSDFNENNNDNGLENLLHVQKWLEMQPYHKEAKISVEMKELSDTAIAEVKKAVEDAVRSFASNGIFMEFLKSNRFRFIFSITWIQIRLNCK